MNIQFNEQADILQYKLELIKSSFHLFKYKDSYGFFILIMPKLILKYNPLTCKTYHKILLQQFQTLLNIQYIFIKCLPSIIILTLFLITIYLIFIPNTSFINILKIYNYIIIFQFLYLHNLFKMTQETEIRQDIDHKFNRTQLKIYESDSLKIYFDLPDVQIQMDSEIQGHIVLHTKKSIKNQDLNVKFTGTCIYYSQNPTIKQQIKTEIILIDKQQTINQSLNTFQKNINIISTRIETFLQGSLTLRYIGDSQAQIQYLYPDHKYFLPFSFYLPQSSPPTVNFMSFPPLFLSIKYTLQIQNYLQQQITLVSKQIPNIIEQLITNTIDFSASRFCFQCFGQYRLQISVTVTQEVLKLKVLYFRKAKKGTRKLLQKVNIKFMAEIQGVGKNVILQKDIRLQIIEYEILGSQFIFDKKKKKFRSLTNELFKLFYYFEVTLFALRYINIKNIFQQKIHIPL